MRIDKKGLVEEIKLMLGFPVLNLEITDAQIEILIDMAFRKIAPKIVGITYKTVAPAPRIDLEPLGVKEVLKAYPTITMDNVMPSGNTTFTNELYFDFQLNKKVSQSTMFSRIIDSTTSVSPDIDYEIGFKIVDHYLFLSSTDLACSVTLECLTEYNSVEDVDDERAQSWIRSYSLTLAKEVVGRIRSKFRSGSIPVELDGETLLSEAQAEKQDLEERLENTDFGQTSILR